MWDMTSVGRRYFEQNKFLKHHVLSLKFTNIAVVNGGGSFLRNMSVVPIFSNKYFVCYIYFSVR